MTNKTRNLAMNSRLALAAALVLAIFGARWTLARQLRATRGGETVPLNHPLKEFPYRIGYWTGSDLPVDPEILRVSGADDYLQRCYVHPSGERIALWMNYSKDSADQFHYPTVCMTGAGWEEEESTRKRMTLCERQIATEDAVLVQSVPALRLYFSKMDNRKYVHYWYYLLGEDHVDRFMRLLSPKNRIFLRGRRNSSLTVEVFSLSTRPNPQLLDEVAIQVAKELDKWIPQGSEASCELGASN